jgi:membrane protease YdiL (CAAX protease family)
MPDQRAVDTLAERERSAALLVGLAVWLAVVVGASALLAPAVLGASDALFGDRFPMLRVFRRLVMLLAVVGLVFWARRLGIRRWSQIGLTAAGWRSGAAGWGFALGTVSGILLFAIELAGGWRVAVGWPGLLDAVEALAAGIVIGLLEEAVCRGFLLFPFAPRSGRRFWLGAAAVSALYSTAHFARGGRGLDLAIDAAVGWRIWAQVPARLVEHWEAWVGLFAVGLLFHALAAGDGHVWRVAGLHAGAVVALQLGGAATEARAGGGDSLFFADGLNPGLPLGGLLLVALLPIARARKPSGPRLPDAPDPGERATG